MTALPDYRNDDVREPDPVKEKPSRAATFATDEIRQLNAMIREMNELEPAARARIMVFLWSMYVGEKQVLEQVHKGQS
jgi:hypothetical protein